MSAVLSFTLLAELLGTLFEQVREGVVLCDATGDVLTANRSAARLLGMTSVAGRKLDELFAGPYLARARLYVQQSPDRKIDFLCANRDDTRLFDCRLYWYGGTNVDSPFGLLSFREALSVENKSQSEGRRCDSIEKLRRPLANLKAAAENLLTYPEMSAVMRSAFENVIAQESVGLTSIFDDLAGLCSERLTGRYDLRPCGGGVLVTRVLALAGDSLKLIRPSVSDPRAVLVDDHWLQQLLLSLYDFLSANKIGLSEVRFDSEATERFVYLDLIWKGQPVKAADIEEWRTLPLFKVPGSPSGADVLRSHGSDLWSQKAEKTGFALVRLPLPSGRAESNNG